MTGRQGMHLVTTTEPVAAVEPRRETLVEGLAGWLVDCVGRLLAARRRRLRPKQMRVVETLAIGGKKQLVLVSCHGERFLVGTGADSVQTMVRVRAEAAAAGGLAEVVHFGDTVR